MVSNHLRYTANPDPPEAHRPKSTIFSAIENPYALREAINKLESSLDEVISLFQAEKNTLAREGSFSKGKQGYVLSFPRPSYYALSRTRKLTDLVCICRTESSSSNRGSRNSSASRQAKSNFSSNTHSVQLHQSTSTF